jgi:hypothetical protein
MQIMKFQLGKDHERSQAAKKILRLENVQLPDY